MLKFINKIVRLTLFLLLLVIANVFQLYSQDGVWIETTGYFNGANVTPEEGKRKALELARAEAIKQVVGLKVTEETYRSISESQTGSEQSTYFDVFSRLNRTTTTGRILDEDYTFNTIVDNGTPKYYAKLRAFVVEEKGEIDPSFKVEINLLKDVYFVRSNIVSENDVVEFTISATKDCYIYLFNIMSNDSVQLIIPNQYIKNNKYEISKTEQEYEKEIKKLGMKFNVGLQDGKSLGKEAFYVIALKDRFDFTSENFNKDELSIIPTYKAAITDIMNWLIQIPANKRTEAFSSFEIRKN